MEYTHQGGHNPLTVPGDCAGLWLVAGAQYEYNSDHGMDAGHCIDRVPEYA